jgi:hypothetical protein
MITTMTSFRSCISFPSSCTAINEKYMLLTYLSYFEELKATLCDPHAVSVCLYHSSPIQVMNWASLQETLFVYHGTPDSLLCCNVFLAVVLSFLSEEIIIAWTHVGLVWLMFHYLPSPVVKEILDSVSSMNPCIAMEDDGGSLANIIAFSWVLAMEDTGTSAVLTRYESVWLWPLRQNERTTAGDMLQHGRRLLVL